MESLGAEPRLHAIYDELINFNDHIRRAQLFYPRLPYTKSFLPRYRSLFPLAGRGPFKRVPVAAGTIAVDERCYLAILKLVLNTEIRRINLLVWQRRAKRTQDSQMATLRS